MKSVKIKSAKYTILYLFLVVPFFKPAGASYYEWFNTIFQIWKMLSMVCCLLYILTNGISEKTITNHLGICGFILFGGIYIYNCMASHSAYSDIINNFITDLLLIFLTISIVKKGKLVLYFKVLDGLFTFWIFMHSLSIFWIKSTGQALFEPIDGDYMYLFGTDNYSAFAMIPMITVVLYCDIMNNPKRNISKKNVFLILFLTTSYIYAKSATAAFACIILCIFQLLRKKWHRILKFFTIKKYLVAVPILLILILKFNIHNYFIDFIANVIGKGAKASTLNARTIIWTQALSLIMQKPLFGYGSFSQEAIDNYILYGVDHTHNLILELLIRTGVIGTISYLLFLINPFIKGGKKLIKSKSNICAAGLMIFLVLSFMDTYPLMQYQYLLMALLYCWKEIENRYKKGLDVYKCEK